MSHDRSDDDNRNPTEGGDDVIIMKDDASLYVVLALKPGDNDWTPVSNPIPRSEALKVVQGQWRMGRKSRLRRA